MTRPLSDRSWRELYDGPPMNQDASRCPGETCDTCPRGGCICPPCACHPCRLRTRLAGRGRTALRRRDDVPARERLFEVEATPIADRARQL